MVSSQAVRLRRQSEEASSNKAKPARAAARRVPCKHFHGEDIPDDDHAAVHGRDDGRKKVDHAHDGGEQRHNPDSPGLEGGAGGGQQGRLDCSTGSPDQNDTLFSGRRK